MKTTFFKFNFVSDIFSTTEFLKTAFLTKICTFRTPCTFFSNIKQWRFVQRFKHQYYLCKLNFFLILTSKLIRTLGPDCSLIFFVTDDINMCLLSFAQSCFTFRHYSGCRILLASFFCKSMTQALLTISTVFSNKSSSF